MDFLKKFKKLKKKGQSGSEIVAFFDVGNGSVGAALARITPDEPPTIFYTTRNPISLKKVPDFDQLTKSMLSTFLDTVMRVQTEGIPLISQQSKSGSITKVMCTYTSPWAATLAKRVVIKQENSTVVTEKQLTDILSKEEADFQKQLKEDKETASVFNTPKLIEQHIMQTLLNGYPVTKPEGKSAREIDVSIVLSAVPTGVFNESTKIVAQLAGETHGFYHTYTITATSILRELFDGTDDFILCDVTSEITDINIIRNGALVQTASMPKGHNFLIRELAKQLNTTAEEVPSLWRMHFAKESSSEQRVNMQNALETIREAWSTEFTKMIDTVSLNTILPSTMFLSVDEEYIVWFSETLESSDFGPVLFSEGSFTIYLITQKLLDKYVILDGDKASFDPFLLLEALFYSKIANIPLDAGH